MRFRSGRGSMHKNDSVDEIYSRGFYFSRRIAD